MTDSSNRRLRIAVLNRVFAPTGGGAERYSIALVEQLAARHDIHVFAQHIEHNWPGVNYHKVSQPLKRPRWINQIWYATATWWATRHGFDVVHSHENTWHGQVQTVHVLPIEYNLFLHRNGLKRLLRWAKIVTSPRLVAYLLLERLRYASMPGRAIVVTSSTLLKTMRDCFPGTAPMLTVVTPGVASVPGASSQSEKMLARKKLGLPQTGHCILFVGNDYRKKGLESLLSAMVELPKDVVLGVVGNPAHIAEFRPQIIGSGLVDRVFFLGAMKDLNPAYQSADCLAHPTLEDTFAMVVLEAMSHGLPVLVSNERYCGIAGMLTPKRNAVILKDPRDVKSITDQLRLILSDHVLRKNMGDAAVSFAMHHLWSQVAMKQEAIYFSSSENSGRW